MDSGLVERILPSIRRSQILLIYRNGGVVNPETLWSDRMLGRGYQKDGDPRSGPLRGRETSQEQDVGVTPCGYPPVYMNGWMHFRADTGVRPYGSLCHQIPQSSDVGRD